MQTRRLPVIAVIAAVVLSPVVACQGGDDPAADDEAEPTPTRSEGSLSDEPRAVGEEAWSPLADAPLGLTEIGAAAFGGELWTIGGLTDGAEVTTVVQVFDPHLNEWRSGPHLPQPVHHASLVATDTQLVLVGGYRTLAFDPVADVLVLDAEHGVWIEAPSLPEPRGAGAAAWDGQRLVYAGGLGERGLADDVWALDDLDGGEWTEIARLSIARDHLAATSDRAGTVWFLGGREGTLETNLATVDRLVDNDLRPTTEVPTTRGGVAAFFTDEHGACLVGGEGPEGTFAEVECVGADETTSLPRLSTARHGLGAAVIDGVAYVALGGTEPGLSVSGTIEALHVGKIT
jgi:N-acetylneuraminic acid mutarotase